MFFAPNKIDVVRRMILAESKEERLQALDKLLEFQKVSRLLSVHKAVCPCLHISRRAPNTCVDQDRHNTYPTPPTRIQNNNVQEDMREIFSVMSGFPVTIRLLDPPLHEFLPHEVRMCVCE